MALAADKNLISEFLLRAGYRFLEVFFRLYVLCWPANLLDI